MSMRFASCANITTNECPGLQIDEEELRDYFLYGKNVKKWARSTSTVALCGIKFFYENTIKRPWPTLQFIRPGYENKLSVVLSRDKVRETLRNIELLRHRACLTTIYSCGLRLPDAKPRDTFSPRDTWLLGNQKCITIKDHG